MSIEYWSSCGGRALGVNRNRAPFMVILSILISVLVTDQIGRAIKSTKLRQRPWVEQTQEDMNCLVCTINEMGEYQSGGRDKSMPSNHSANVISLAFIISLFFPKIKITVYTLASIIMLSRVYIGVHYPSDVIAGWLLGTVFGLMLVKSWKYFNKAKI